MFVANLLVFILSDETKLLVCNEFTFLSLTMSITVLALGSELANKNLCHS